MGRLGCLATYIALTVGEIRNAAAVANVERVGWHPNRVRAKVTLLTRFVHRAAWLQICNRLPGKCESIALGAVSWQPRAR
jgi:hypothetical protein